MESHGSAATHQPRPLDAFARPNPSRPEDLGVGDDDPEGPMGALEVFIHQATGIQNICIYHKQDVYARLCLTSDPDRAMSTEIVAAGGNDPVFNQKLRLDVRTLDCSLKCEIWMHSRIRNYMKDQYLGFALVPIPDVLAGNVKPAQEFSLSSTDLTHAPAGFVRLSITYNGLSPEVLEVPAPCSSLVSAKADSANDFGRIEFPDPKIINGTRQLVSEYFRVPRAEAEPENSVSMGAADEDTDPDDRTQEVDSISVSKINDECPKVSPTDDSQSVTDTLEDSKSPGKEDASSKEEKRVPASANVEEEQKVVQQEIVDMYMKSMQEFTDSLAKMELPLSTESGPAISTEGSSGEKPPASKENGNRVFYGSRAFY